MDVPHIALVACGVVYGLLNWESARLVGRQLERSPPQLQRTARTAVIRLSGTRLAERYLRAFHVVDALVQFRRFITPAPVTVSGH